MADDHHHGDIIIIKKKSGGGHGHHGGAWKIAFADFMTAMMAFFLVLWIINATDKETKTVIARYFNPVKLENPSKAKKGVHGATSAPSEGKEEKSDKSNGPPSKDKDAKGSPPHEAKAEASKQAEKPASAEAKAESAEAKEKAAEAKAQAAEAQLFAAPYQTLDRIAGGASDASPGAAAEKGDADPQRMAGALSVEAFRDPFKPIGPGAPDDPAAFDADARNKQPTDIEPGRTGQDDKPHPKPLPSTTPAPTPAEKLAPGDAPRPAPEPSGGPADEGKSADGAAEQIKTEIAAALKSGKGPSIETKQTKDGLLISLTDKLDFSMFGLGSAEPRPELVKAMEAIAKIVEAKPGPIVVRGYTDARPYRNGAYDNWRLSSDRAQMAYYMLTRAGAPVSRFVRVEGYADRALKDPQHPLAAVNRRLEILIEAAK